MKLYDTVCLFGYLGAVFGEYFHFVKNPIIHYSSTGLDENNVLLL